MDFKDKLNSHLKQFHTNPYLFIGSGISRRYLNLPTWFDLLKEFHSISKIPKTFEYYVSKSDSDMSKLASILANEFHEIWWNDISFLDSRNLNMDIAKVGISMPLKIELAKYVNSYSTQNLIQNDETNLFGHSIIDGIITTNWDNFLDFIFPDFKIFVGQQQLLFSDSFNVGEIYKIHGSSYEPKSIIVTAEDYHNFNEKNSYLAAKLLTIFVEHPIIFLGYSLTDKNILEILSSIMNCVDNENVNKLQDRLIFVLWDSRQANPTLTNTQIMLAQGKILPIQLLKLNSFVQLFEVLKDLKKRLPVKLLRKLKDSVIEFVKTSKPNDIVFLGDLENLDENSKVEFVIGVGVSKSLSQQGYKGVKAIDIVEDVIFDNKNFNASMLIEETLTDLIKGNVYIPVCKYLRKEGYLLKNGNLSSSGSSFLKDKFIFRNNMPDCFLSKYYLKKKDLIIKQYDNISNLIEAENIDHALEYLPMLDKSNINLDELKIFLIKCFSDKKISKKTSFKKLVCFYDYLKYAQETQ